MAMSGHLDQSGRSPCPFVIRFQGFLAMPLPYVMQNKSSCCIASQCCGAKTVERGHQQRDSTLRTGTGDLDMRRTPDTYV